MWTADHRTPNQIQTYIPDNISEIDKEPDLSLEIPEELAAQLIRQDHKSSSTHTFGAIKVNYIFYFVLPILLAAPAYSYHMAVSHHQEKPYPHATITNTSCYYPQDITFRLGMLPFAGFINLAYYILFKWLKYEKKKNQYPGSIYQWLNPLGQASVLGFLAAIGTIDGAGYPDVIHGGGAVFFFIVLFLITAIVTLVMKDMHDWDSTFLTSKSVLIKLLLTEYISLTAVYCLIGSLMQLKENDDDPYLVIIQWNLVYVCLIWLLTFTLDFKTVFITLKGNYQQLIKQIPQIDNS